MKMAWVCVKLHKKGVCEIFIKKEGLVTKKNEKEGGESEE